MAQARTVVHLKTQLSEHDHFDSKLSMMVHYDTVSEMIIRCLNKAELNEMISRTQFGNLIVSASDFNLSNRLLWYLMERQTCILKKDEFWMVIKKMPLRFSLLEYCLITGLHCSGNIPKIPETWDFQSRHFQGRSIIRLSDLEKRLVEMVDGSLDVNVEKLKLASLLFVVGVLGPRRSKKDVIVSSWLIRLVEEFDSFNKYPWGTRAYKEVLITLRKNLVVLREETLRKQDKGGSNYGNCTISGFVQPLQILAYECIPGIANAFATRKDAENSAIPRMCRWKTKAWKRKGSPMYDYIVEAVNESKEIIGLLIPTSEEMHTKYYMTGVFEGLGSDDNLDRITSLLSQGRKVICSQRPVDTTDKPSTSASPPSIDHHQSPPQINDDSNRFSAMLNELKNWFDERINQLKIDILAGCKESLNQHKVDILGRFDERFKALEEQLNQLKVDLHGGFSGIQERLSKLQSNRGSKRPMEFNGNVEILSDDSSSSETENDRQKNGPSVEISTEERLIRSAQSYQELMKLIPVPMERGTVIPYNSWVGLGNSIKQIYKQPLHYLTNVHLKRLDEARLGSDDEDVPLDMTIHPCKAEASIWIIEETHRRTVSPRSLAKLWSADPMYDAYIDDKQ